MGGLLPVRPPSTPSPSKLTPDPPPSGPNLRRTLIVAGVQCFQAGQGNSFITNYGVVFLQAIGVHNTYQTQVLLIFTTTISSVFPFYFADRIGRRLPLIVGAVVMGVCMYVVAGVTGYAPADDAAALKAATAALFVWQFFLSSCWSSWYVWRPAAPLPLLHAR